MRAFIFIALMGAACQNQAEVSCKDAPLLTYNNFGQGFMAENCQGCHASTSLDRNDAPEEVTFDTVEEIWDLSQDILDAAAFDEPVMPPRGGITEEDRLRLQVWLTCTPPGN